MEFLEGVNLAVWREMQQTGNLHFPMIANQALARTHLRSGQGLGFSQGDISGDGGDPAGAIIAGIAAAVGAIFGGFGGQRGKDEATSGVYLTNADTAKNVILLEYQRGNLTKDQARGVFESNVIQPFINQIAQLGTKSVRDSRINNQVTDLRRLFETSLATLPLLFSQGNQSQAPAEAPQQTPQLPGYCPAGTYHPIENPLICAPFPEDGSSGGQGTSAAATAAKAAKLAAKIAAKLKQPCSGGQVRYPLSGNCVPAQCPAGTQRNPATGKCVALGSCPPGQYLDPVTRQCTPWPTCQPGQQFDIQSGRCVTPGEEFDFSDIPWWAYLLGAIVVIQATDSDGYRGRR